jgi:hypothetical protein
MLRQLIEYLFPVVVDDIFSESFSKGREAGRVQGREEGKAIGVATGKILGFESGYAEGLKVGLERHSSVAMPVEAQQILSNPYATQEEINAAFAMAVVIPDPKHQRGLDEQLLLDKIVDISCHCDLLNGYNCGIHEVVAQLKLARAVVSGDEVISRGAGLMSMLDDKTLQKIRSQQYYDLGKGKFAVIPDSKYELATLDLDDLLNGYVLSEVFHREGVDAALNGVEEKDNPYIPNGLGEEHAGAAYNWSLGWKEAIGSTKGASEPLISNLQESEKRVVTATAAPGKKKRARKKIKTRRSKIR